MSVNTQPPFYVLFSHSSLTASSPVAPSNILGHPTIQYHYADDSPLSLLPQNPDEHVLVLNYDPASTGPPTVKSISKDLTVVGLKVEDAPGVGVTEESSVKSDKMYIIETIASDDRAIDGSMGGRKAAQAILTQFKQRNAILRRALLYPSTTQLDDITPHNPPFSLPSSPSI